MEPTISDATVYYSRNNPKRQLRGHIVCQVPNNCSLTTVSFVYVNNNLARATFAVSGCTGTATSLTQMDADANITLQVDYDRNHQTEFILVFTGGEVEETKTADTYKRDED